MAKTYTKREDICSAVIHAAGLAAALPALIPLLHCAGKYGGAAAYGAVVFYWLSILFMLGASMIYHLPHDEKSKAFWRQFDHCAIYLLITGTYAPLIFLYLQNAAGYTVFTILLAATVAGIGGKIVFKQRFHKIEVALYLLMGWCCVAIAKPMLALIPHFSLWLLLAGGIAYSGGVILYAMRREFAHAAWHIAVLAGVVLHYMCIIYAAN